MGLATNLKVGDYTVSWNGNALGLTMGAKVVQLRGKSKEVRASLYADAVIDEIYRGADCFVAFTLKEWTANIRATLWPFGAWGEMGAPGRLVEALAQALVLTPVTGTPAATIGLTYTFTKAILSPPHNVDVPHDHDETDVPVVMRIFPYDNAGTVQLFTTA